jgi:hypothetical protein
LKLRKTVKDAIKDGQADPNAKIAGMFTVVYTGQQYMAVPGDRIPPKMEAVLQLEKDTRLPAGWKPVLRQKRVGL